MNIRTVNAAIRRAAIPLILTRGRGYFYWRGKHGILDVPSVYVNNIDDLTIEEWIDEAWSAFTSLKK